MMCSFKLLEEGFTNQCPFKSIFASNLVALSEGGRRTSLKTISSFFVAVKKVFTWQKRPVVVRTLEPRHLGVSPSEPDTNC